jgi:hypothetical protein
MKCMSCRQEVQGPDLRRFNHLFLCAPCHEMADKADREIEQTFSRAREMSKNWLETHILQGGLLAGGPGHGVRAAAANGVSLPPSEVSGVRSAQALPSPSPSDSDRH